MTFSYKHSDGVDTADRFRCNMKRFPAGPWRLWNAPSFISRRWHFVVLIMRWQAVVGQVRRRGGITDFSIPARSLPMLLLLFVSWMKSLFSHFFQCAAEHEGQTEPAIISPSDPLADSLFIHLTRSSTAAGQTGKGGVCCKLISATVTTTARNY